MIYRDIDRCYLYQIAPKFPDNFVVNTTSPKEYGQKLFNRKRGNNSSLIIQ